MYGGFGGKDTRGYDTGGRWGKGQKSLRERGYRLIVGLELLNRGRESSDD